MKNWLIVIILMVLGGIAWYLFDVREPAVEEAPPPPIVEQEAAPPAPVEPPPEPVISTPEPTTEPVIEALPLPALADSDPVVIESLEGLVGAEPVAQFVAHEDLVSRVVATVDALSSQQVPAAIKPVEGPGGEFQATADDDPQSVVLDSAGDPIPQYVVDPVNYARYTPYVEILEAAEPEDIAAAYREYSPLFEEAFRQLGYPEGDFNQRLRAVIDELLATPDVTEPPRLIKPEAYYLYADEDLESLSAGQKVLIRMGPENAARVKARLAAIRGAL